MSGKKHTPHLKVLALSLTLSFLSGLLALALIPVIKRKKPSVTLQQGKWKNLGAKISWHCLFSVT
jgi:hypothetical protein